MLPVRKKLTEIRNYNCNLISVISQKNETLSEYVKRIRHERNLSTTDVERASKNKISSSYVTRIENEPNKKLSVDKLQALAQGLGVSKFEILEAAGFHTENLDEIYGYFSGFEHLQESDKDELKPMLVMLASDIRRRLTKKREGKQ